jgi:hypothetical protein
MEKIRDILLFFAAAMAVFALLCAVYQAMNDRVASASLLSAIFLVCVLVVFLPKLEVLEAWGIKAHLVRTLNEADEIVAKLRRLAITNAKGVYLNIGISNRMGVTAVKEKQTLLDEIDNQLRELSVSAEDRKALGSTYVRLIGYDMYMVYVRTLERYFAFKQQYLTNEVNKNNESPLRAELEQWRAARPTWKPNNSLFESLHTYSFEDEIQRVTPTGWLSDTDQKSVESFKNEMLSLFRGVAAKGGWTPEAADYYDKYRDLGGQDKKIVELFGFNPSEPR